MHARRPQKKNAHVCEMRLFSVIPSFQRYRATFRHTVDANLQVFPSTGRGIETITLEPSPEGLVLSAQKHKTRTPNEKKNCSSTKFLAGRLACRLASY